MMAQIELDQSFRTIAAMPANTDQPEALAGLVERVTFHNEENGFCVLRVKARGQKDLITYPSGEGRLAEEDERRFL